MQPTYNNNQQLPFATDRPMWPVQQINMNNLPFVPQNIQAPQWLLQYVPFVTGVTMDMVSRGTQSGPVSLFFFNMMAQNNWANQQFAQLIQDVCDFIFIENQHWTPPPHQIEGVIGQGIQTFLQMRTMASLIEFPPLWGFINQADHGNVQQIHARFQQYMSRIMNMRGAGPVAYNVGQPVGGNMYGGGYGQPPQGGYMPPQPQRHVPYTTGGAAYQAHQVHGAPGQPVHFSGRSDSSGGRDYAVPANTPEPAPAPMAAVPQYPTASSVAPQFTPRKETTMTNNAVPDTGNIDANLLAPDAVKWRMSPNHPQFAYPPAFNPITQQLRFALNGDKSTVPHFKEGTAPVIDYDRHAIATLFGNPTPGMLVARDNKQVMSKLSSGIENIREDSANATEEKPTTLTKQHMLTDISLDSAWAIGKVEQMTNGKPVVYRMFARVFNALIGTENETDIIDNFAKSSSYVELREKIKSAAETASPELVSEVNLMMTAHVNHVLHKCMSIAPVEAGGITVEDFVQDLDELLKALTVQFGDGIQKAFLKNQRRYIAQMFQTLEQGEEGSLYETLSINLMGGEEPAVDKDAPQFTFVGKTYNLTLIDVLSHDLQVSGVEGIGNALIPQVMPVLHQLAVDIFEADSQFGGNVAHHLVRTKDGRIFEVTQGHINEDFLLISLVH